MAKHFERVLPGNYREAKVVDASSKKMTLCMNAAALALFAVCFIAGMLLMHIDFGALISARKENAGPFALHIVVFIVCTLAYIVLHELTHGLAYKLLTKEKLTFGMKVTVAYCGVPHIYVYRKAALISLLAPFTVFTVVFAVMTAVITNPLDRLLSLVLLSTHLSGCVGDLYDTLLYLFRFRDPRTLMQDTGPKQTFYLPE